MTRWNLNWNGSECLRSNSWVVCRISNSLKNKKKNQTKIQSNDSDLFDVHWPSAASVIKEIAGPNSRNAFATGDKQKRKASARKRKEASNSCGSCGASSEAWRQQEV